MNHSFKTAFCGIMTALSLVCMFIAPLLPAAIYTCTLLSGLCIALTVDEVGLRYAAGVYFASSILALLLIPDKETAIVFILIFGIYPIIKNVLEQNKNKLPQKNVAVMILKILFINLSCAAYFFVTVYLLGVPKETFMIGDVYLPGVFLVMGNLLCIMYDRNLDILIDFYKIKFRKNIFRKW